MSSIVCCVVCSLTTIESKSILGHDLHSGPSEVPTTLTVTTVRTPQTPPRSSVLLCHYYGNIVSTLTTPVTYILWWRGSPTSSTQSSGLIIDIKV